MHTHTHGGQTTDDVECESHNYKADFASLFGAIPQCKRYARLSRAGLLAFNLHKLCDNGCWHCGLPITEGQSLRLKLKSQNCAVAKTV